MSDCYDPPRTMVSAQTVFVVNLFFIPLVSTHSDADEILCPSTAPSNERTPQGPGLPAVVVAAAVAGASVGTPRKTSHRVNDALFIVWPVSVFHSST